MELASCCHPVRGDQVMGVRTAFGSVLVHRLHCDRMTQVLRDAPSRAVGVRWSPSGQPGSAVSASPPAVSPQISAPGAASPNGAPNQTVVASGYVGGRACQPARLVLTARDSDGLLSYVSGLVANCGKSIRRASTVSNLEAGTATLAFEILVEDTVELQNLLDCFRACDDILASRRVGPNESAEFFPFDSPPPHSFDMDVAGAGRTGASAGSPSNGRARPATRRGLQEAADEKGKGSSLPEAAPSERRPPSPQWQYSSNGTVSSMNGATAPRSSASSPAEGSDGRSGGGGSRGGGSTFAAQAHALGRHELQRSEVEIDGDANYLASLEAASEQAARNGASGNGRAPVEAEPADILDNLDDLDDEQ